MLTLGKTKEEVKDKEDPEFTMKKLPAKEWVLKKQTNKSISASAFVLYCEPLDLFEKTLSAEVNFVNHLSNARSSHPSITPLGHIGLNPVQNIQCFTVTLNGQLGMPPAKTC